MVDYAQQKVLESQHTKERVEAAESAIGISLFGFMAVVVVAFLIYVSGYQSMRVSYIQHSINSKKRELASLSVTLMALQAEREKLLSSRVILSHTKNLNITKEIQIAY